MNLKLKAIGITLGFFVMTATIGAVAAHLPVQAIGALVCIGVAYLFYTLVLGQLEITESLKEIGNRNTEVKPK